MSFRFPIISALAATVVLFLPSGAHAQTLSTDALIKALQQGGHVIVMRHASSPRDTPSKETANPDNPNLERQLDAAGRTSAVAMGDALRALKIPIGEVLTSPTYRALETIRLARLPAPRPYDELGDGGQSMQGVPESQGAWLRDKVLQSPSGTNTLIVTHLPNLTRAFPDSGSAIADGEALIFRPNGKGPTALVGRVKIDEWPNLH
ncbi:MAG: hypothetical protein ABI652_06545 [Acidobacteriota bacterium]